MPSGWTKVAEEGEDVEEEALITFDVLARRDTFDFEMKEMVCALDVDDCEMSLLKEFDEVVSFRDSAIVASMWFRD